MPKPDFSEKLKNESPDPKAFERFKDFTKKLLKVSKREAEEIDRGGSSSTETRP